MIVAILVLNAFELVDTCFHSFHGAYSWQVDVKQRLALKFENKVHQVFSRRGMFHCFIYDVLWCLDFVIDELQKIYFRIIYYAIFSGNIVRRSGGLAYDKLTNHVAISGVTLIKVLIKPYKAISS